jgi:hypothetical protein
MKGKKTGGRKKGTPNKATLRIEAEVMASGETPRDYMLRVMRDETADSTRRDAMAKAVAPYVHPTLQAVKPGTNDSMQSTEVTWKPPVDGYAEETGGAGLRPAPGVSAVPLPDAALGGPSGPQAGRQNGSHRQ